MPATLAQIEGFFLARKLKYRREPEQIVVGFDTNRYRDGRGRPGVAIVVRLDEDGKYLELVAPGIYGSRDCGHPSALFQTLLDITMRTKMIRYEHDPADGEIRCTIDCPLEDAELTAEQFHRMLDCLVESIDRWHPAIRRAMDTGLARLDPARDLAAATPA